MTIEEIKGVSGPLHNEHTGSNCCGAKVYDPGGTGQGLCGSCGEHCEDCYLQDLDVAVLNYDGGTEVEIFRIVFDSASDEYDDMLGCVEGFLLEKFGGTSNLKYMYSNVSPIRFLDHRKDNG